MDQHDAQQLDRLGDALGALLKAAAASKEDFLVKAAARDGFFFGDGVFRAVGTTPNSFAMTRVEDLALIDDRARRLHLIANESPKDAIVGAMELIESVCRTVLRLLGESVPGKKANRVDIVEATLEALDCFQPREPCVPVAIEDSKNVATLGRKCVQHLGAAIVRLDELQNVYGSDHARDDKVKGLSSRHARLVVGAVVALTRFVAETYEERVGSKTA